MFAGSVWPAASGVVAIKSRWTKSWCWQHLGRDFSFATALTETPTKRHVAGFDLTHNYRSKSYHQHDRDLPFSGSLDRNNNRMLWLKKLPKKSLSDSEFNLFCCGLVDIHTHPLWGICSVSCTLCICSNTSSPALLHTAGQKVPLSSSAERRGHNSWTFEEINAWVQIELHLFKVTC